MKGQILICTAIMLNDHSNPYIESTTVLSDIYMWMGQVKMEHYFHPQQNVLLQIPHVLTLGECYALWGERERRAVVSVSNLRC